VHRHVYQELLPMHTKGVRYSHEGLAILLSEMGM